MTWKLDISIIFSDILSMKFIFMFIKKLINTLKNEMDYIICVKAYPSMFGNWIVLVLPMAPIIDHPFIFIFLK